MKYHCCCSVTKSCPSFCNSVDCSLPDFSLHCPSLSPRVGSNSCPLSWWCYLSISSSATLFTFCLQSLPASGSFLMSWLFTSKVLQPHLQHQPSNKYSALIYFRIDWFDFLAVQGTLKRLLQHHSSRASILQCSAFYGPMLTSVHDYWKTIALTIYGLLLAKVMSLLFNMLSRLVIAFLPRSKHLLISWLQSPSAVIWSPRK